MKKNKSHKAIQIRIVVSADRVKNCFHLLCVDWQARLLLSFHRQSPPLQINLETVQINKSAQDGQIVWRC